MTKKYYKSTTSYSKNSCREIVLYTGPLTRASRPQVNPDSFFYDVLGVQRRATPDQIKTAYKQLARKYHPDKNGDDEEKRIKFMEVKRAYEVLMNPEKRIIYDRFGMKGIEMAEQNGDNSLNFLIRIFNNPCFAGLVLCLSTITCCWCCFCCCLCCCCLESAPQEDTEEIIIITQPGAPRPADRTAKPETIRMRGFTQNTETSNTSSSEP